VAEAFGFEPFSRVVDFLERELERASAKRRLDSPVSG